MLRLKVIYISLLILLALVVVYSVSQPMSKGSQHSDIKQEQVIKSDDEYIVQFILANPESTPTEYRIETFIDGKRYVDQVTLTEGNTYVYVRRIQYKTVINREVNFVILKNEAPIREVTYYLLEHRD